MGETRAAITGSYDITHYWHMWYAHDFVKWCEEAMQSAFADHNRNFAKFSISNYFEKVWTATWYIGMH